MLSLVLTLISKIQRLLLRTNSTLAAALYYKLAILHFNLYARTLEAGSFPLAQEVSLNSTLGKAALRRHSRLVINTLYKKSDIDIKRVVRYAAKEHFRKYLARKS